MEESGGGDGMIRYYCTAGNGMETFLIEEVKTKLAAENVCQFPGKVSFSSSAKLSKLSDLKTAERLFLLIKQDSPLRLSPRTSPAKAAAMLQSKVADINQWSKAVVTWSRLQRELSANKAEGEVKQDEESENLEESPTCELQEGERRKKRRKSEGQNGIPASEKKRQTDKDGENLEKEEFQETNERKEEETFKDFLGGCVNKRSHSICSRKQEQNVNKMRKDETSGKKENISFRISCKCNGSLIQCLNSQEISKVIGAAVSKLLGWKVDLKNPQLDINVNLTDDYCLLGIPLTRLPLANRSYIKTTGLRSTVAWAMASLANIQPGFRVIDPMCGVGTILIEAAHEHKAACFLGVDIDDGQVRKTEENIAHAELGNRIHLLKASATALPLPSASVDAVICDLPFGRKFSTTSNMAANLPLILREMERVLRLGGTLVALLSPQLSAHMKKLLVQKQTGPTSNQEAKLESGTQICYLKHQITHRISLGAIDGLIHKYVKTKLLT